MKKQTETPWDMHIAEHLTKSELRRIKFYLLSSWTEWARWQDQVSVLEEKRRTAGWTFRIAYGYGKLRRLLEQRYLLTPEESSAAMESLSPEVQYDLCRWSSQDNLGDMSDATEYIYRRWQGLSVSDEVVVRLWNDSVNNSNSNNSPRRTFHTVSHVHEEEFLMGDILDDMDDDSIFDFE